MKNIFKILSVTLMLLLPQLLFASKLQVPTAPTNVIATYSPAWTIYTIRASWANPKKWNDDGNVTLRTFSVECVNKAGVIVFSQDNIPANNNYLVQFEVPLNDAYTFRVAAVNSLGNKGNYSTYRVTVP